MDKAGNTAFIDGQNLYLGTRESGWSVDTARFRVYLKDKYNITEAYYFMGVVKAHEQELYDALQKQGYILSFREHSPLMVGKKKGNVDCDIIFGVMKRVADGDPMDKVFIVSGDGDYKRMVDYLVKKDRFGKMLFPNRSYASSLYDALGGEYFAHLEDPAVKAKIEYKKK